MFRIANTMLMAMSRRRIDARPACSACAPMLAMPTMEDARGDRFGLLATDWAYLGLDTWCHSPDNPDGENKDPMPRASWSVSCHMVVRAAPGASNGLMDAVAVSMSTPR